MMRLWYAVLTLAAVGAPGVYPGATFVDAGIADLAAERPAVRQRAAAQLGRLGDRAAVSALIRALADPQPSVRREAARALGELRDPKATLPLVGALNDADQNVRFHAAHALGELKDPQAVPGLLQALRDQQWCVRDQAAWALRECHDPAAIQPVVEALTVEQTDVAHAVWLLRQLGDAKAVPLLAALLGRSEAGVRERAVQALAALGVASATEPLIQALADTEIAVRRRAAAALAKSDEARVVDACRVRRAVEPDPGLREQLRQWVDERSRDARLAGYWSFDQDDGKVARDLAGRGTDGVIKGCTRGPGKVGQALRFGAGHYVALGKPAKMPMEGRPVTVMAWARSEQPSGVVVARGGAFCGYSLYLKDGMPRFGIHREQGGPTYIAAGREPVVGAWVHLAGVIREDRIELYTNGVLTASATTPGYLPSNAGQGMEIGFDEATSPAEICDNFEGWIDEVRVYEAALSATEIARLAQEGSAAGGEP